MAVKVANKITVNNTIDRYADTTQDCDDIEFSFIQNTKG